jgi:protein-S-isoprenylcysteine O-methyltransferase Ste14
MSQGIFNTMVWGWIGVAALTVPYLLFIAAPYGRHARPGWGPALNPRLGWVLMESPALALVPWFFFTGTDFSAPKIVFVLFWSLHYMHRTLIFPFRMKLGARMPAAIACSGFFFNLVNGYMQGTWLFRLSPPYPDGWLAGPAFIIGAALFVCGFLVNSQSDSILSNLRKPGETGYKIPKGGLFRWVSSPNYFGEILEWTGWAVATWSFPGLAFALWTTANLAPRAIKHHQWYRRTFPCYPPNRRAVLPFLL